MPYRDKKGKGAANKALGQRGTTMGSVLRVLIAIALILTVGLTACGKRGSLDRPPPTHPETTADPSTKMSQAPNRPLWIDRLLQ
jgi:predicted small lipoprotein YifL